MSKILILGGVSFDTLLYMDRLPDPAPQTVFVRRMHETVGGTGAGKALNLCRLGFDVTLHGLIHADHYGEQVCNLLTRQPRLTFLHEDDPGGTPRHINLMAGSGERLTIFAVPGTFEPMVDWNALENVIADSDAVMLNIINYCRQAIPLLRKHHKTAWVDLHDYDGQNPYHQDFIDAAEVLFLSSDRLPDYRAFMQQQIAGGKRLVVCTHGRRGSTALTPSGEWIETPIVPVSPLVDSNGAGDAFMAGFFYGTTQGYSTRRCAQLATVTAGLCVASPELADFNLSPALLEAQWATHFKE